MFLIMSEIQIAYSVIFLSFGMLFTIVIPATTITSEKEAGSWQLLLTTTQSDWQIIWAKFIGVIRRCLPVWFFLFGHLILFSSFWVYSSGCVDSYGITRCLGYCISVLYRHIFQQPIQTYNHGGNYEFCPCRYYLGPCPFSYSIS